MRNATNTMLCWNPGTSEVALVPWPDQENLSSSYARTALASSSTVRSMPEVERTAMVFIEAVHLIVRDRCDHAAVHAALLGVSEYANALAHDMPGLSPLLTASVPAAPAADVAPAFVI